MNDPTDILQHLHDSEINGMVSWFFDGVFRWAIGDDLNGWKRERTAPDLRLAIVELAENAFAEFPRSNFAAW